MGGQLLTAMTFLEPLLAPWLWDVQDTQYTIWTFEASLIMALKDAPNPPVHSANIQTFVPKHPSTKSQRELNGMWVHL